MVNAQAAKHSIGQGATAEHTPKQFPDLLVQTTHLQLHHGRENVTTTKARGTLTMWSQNMHTRTCFTGSKSNGSNCKRYPTPDIVALVIAPVAMLRRDTVATSPSPNPGDMVQVTK